VVSCRLPDGPRQARRLGQISAARTGGGVSDGLDLGAQAAPRAEGGSGPFAAVFLEADETFIGGRGDPTSRGRSTASPDKSMVVAAVEKVPAPKNNTGKHGHAVKRQHGFFAGNARIAVLPAATGAELGAFLTGNVAAGSHLLTDGFAGYRGRDAALGQHLKHTPVVQDDGANAGQFSRSSIPSSATSKPGSSAPITWSAPSTCRVISGNDVRHHHLKRTQKLPAAVAQPALAG
jgi:hypothetical protein